MRTRRHKVLEKGRRVREQTYLTDELLEGILRARTSDAVAEMAYTDAPDLPGFLNEMLERKGLRRIDVVHAANLNETFGYQIFTGARRPSRDKVLALAFALGLDLHETQRLLSLADAGSLYSKNRRDAIIIFCIAHGYTLERADEELYRFGEKTVSDDA